ncbi:MAG: MogA/MoaB family molybdenum cofactor biosynthesis protein [Candidatus Thorarchaeota archaeon]
MPQHEHRRDQKIRTGFAVLTITDSRTVETDESGRIAKELISQEGHTVVAYDLIPNDSSAILDRIEKFAEKPEIRVIITSGGTGVGRRDLTTQTLITHFDRILVGFGELFRRLSYEEIGIPGIYSQASAGIIGNTVIYCLPGSKNAMRMALTKIILPGIGHLLWEVDR